MNAIIVKDGAAGSGPLGPLAEGLPYLEPVVVVVASMHPASVYLSSLSSGSRSAMKGALDLAAGLLTVGRCDHLTMPWELVRAPHVRALRAWLLDNRAASTGNKVLSAVRGALKAAWDLGIMETEPYRRAVTIKGIKVYAKDQATGRALSFGEVASLLGCCASDPLVTGVRDAVLIILGVYGGLRGVEMSRLLVGDVELHANQLRVRGKGNKAREIPLSGGMIAALEDWLHVLGDEEANLESRLLRRILKNGVVLSAGLSVQAVHGIVGKRCQQAKLIKFCPHDARRTYAGELLDAGADLSVVSALMGHSSTQTTARYDRRGRRARENAMNLMHVAYERRY